MSSRISTSVAVDNVDHNPSSTTAKQTAIFLMQRPKFYGGGIYHRIIICGGLNERGPKIVDRFAHFYTYA